jgi:hypothetical protein
MVKNNDAIVTPFLAIGTQPQGSGSGLSLLLMSPSSDEQGTDIAHQTVVVGVRITRAGSAASVKMPRCAENRRQGL